MFISFVNSIVIETYLPSGPLMCTVDVGCVLLILPLFPCLGVITLNVTSGGIDSGAFPIFDRRGDEVAKLLNGEAGWKAGRRNEGRDTELFEVEVIVTHCAQRRRTGPNMAVVFRLKLCNSHQMNFRMRVDLR